MLSSVNARSPSWVEPEGLFRNESTTRKIDLLMICFFSVVLQATCVALYFCPSPLTLYFQVACGFSSLMGIGYCLSSLLPSRSNQASDLRDEDEVPVEETIRRMSLHPQVGEKTIEGSAQATKHVLSKTECKKIRHHLQESAAFALGQEEFIVMLEQKNQKSKNSLAIDEQALAITLEKMQKWFPAYLQESLKEVATNLSSEKMTPESELRSSFALFECLPVLLQNLEEPAFYDDLKACLERWIEKTKAAPYLNPVLALLAPLQPLLMQPSFPGRAFLTDYLKKIVFELVPQSLSSRKDTFSRWKESQEKFEAEKIQLQNVYKRLPFHLQTHVVAAEEKWKARKGDLLKLEYYLGPGVYSALPLVLEAYHRYWVLGEPADDKLMTGLKNLEKEIHQFKTPQAVTFQSYDMPAQKLEDVIALTSYLNQTLSSVWQGIPPLLKTVLAADASTSQLGESLIAAFLTIGSQIQTYFPSQVGGLGDYASRSYPLGKEMAKLYADEETKPLVRRAVLKLFCVPKDKEAHLLKALETLENDKRFKQALELFAFQDIFWLLPFVTFLTAHLRHLMGFIKEHMSAIIAFIAKFSEDKQIEAHKTSLELLMKGGLTLFGGPINALIFSEVPGKSFGIKTAYKSFMKTTKTNTELPSEVKSLLALMDSLGLLLLQGLFGSKPRLKTELKAHITACETLTKELYQFDPVVLQGEPLKLHLIHCLQSYLK